MNKIKTFAVGLMYFVLISSFTVSVANLSKMLNF